MAWINVDLAENSRFIARVTQALIKVAIQVQNEAPTQPYHAERGTFAARVLADPGTWGGLFARALADDPNVLVGTPDCSDPVIEGSIASFWDAFALVKV